MSLYEMFDSDPNLEKGGIVCDYGSTRIVIARAGGSNAKFRNTFQRKAKPYRHQIDNDQLSDEVSNKLMAEVYAEAVILRIDTKKEDGTWDNGKVELKGKGLVEATPENVVQLLTDLPDLFRDLQTMANKAANYRRQEEAADLGNSSTS